MTAATNTTDTAAWLARSIMTLPPLPATAQEILTCFGDEFIDADRVAQVVEGDPGICAKLLGLSNSAYFGLAEPVHTIRDAISLVLGVDTVRSLVLAMAIQQSFDNSNCPSFDVERFWRQSLLAAECCKRLVAIDDAASGSDRDLAYSAGLCHNLGLMALTHMEPVRTDRVLAGRCSDGKLESLTTRFLDEFNTDHKIMSAELARAWSLPAQLLAAYQYRAFPHIHCDVRLGIIVAAGVAVVENEELEDDQKTDLGQWAAAMDIDADQLHKIAVFGERQIEQTYSLASNMAR